MTTPEPEERAPADLARALGAIARTQSLWLIEVDHACRGEPAFVAAFRRWEELLTALKLHLHRAESRLLHYVLAGGPRPWREFTPPPLDREEATRKWVERLTLWFAALRIDPTYRRLPSVLESDEEPANADIITDLATLAELAETTLPVLRDLERPQQQDCLEDLAFYHVIAPWKQRGQPALLDVLRWLAEMAREHDDI